MVRNKFINVEKAESAKLPHIKRVIKNISMTVFMSHYEMPKGGGLRIAPNCGRKAPQNFRKFSPILLTHKFIRRKFHKLNRRLYAVKLLLKLVLSPHKIQ